MVVSKVDGRLGINQTKTTVHIKKHFSYNVTLKH